MIGLVLVTHGRLAEELKLAMEHVVGPQRYVATVCIGPEDDMERARAHICGCVTEVDQGDGVVVLTDMFGGTPSNLALTTMNGRNVEVIAGVNLPLLVKLAKVRGSEPLAQAVEHAQAAGRKYIACASDVLQSHEAPAAPPPLNGTLAVGGVSGGGGAGPAAHPGANNALAGNVPGSAMGGKP